MIREAIEYLGDIFRQGDEPKTVETGTRHVKTIFFPSTKETKNVSESFPVRGHSFLTLDSFIKAVEKYGDAQSTVFVNLTSVVCVLADVDSGYREDKLTLALSLSPVFADLDALKTPVKQDVLTRMLRTAFSQCEWSAPVRESVETIRWIRNESGDSDISAGRNSFGKSVLAEVSGMKTPIPEQATCTFRPYPTLENVGSVCVDCSLIVDQGAQTFLLQPQPMEVEAAKIRARELVRDYLAEHLECDCFIGSP